MAGKHKPRAPEGAKLPRFERVALSSIFEPELPARATMNEGKMTELIDSLRTLGQIEPITLEEQKGGFELITGHRRYLAARALKWADIAAMVYAEGTAQAGAMMLHENLVREDLNPAEEALYMAQAREKFALDEEGLCRFFHRSADYIGGRFALLRGDAEIFAALQRGELRLGVAHELNRITDEGMRRYYLDLARRSDPSARVVHGWVQEWIGQQRPPLPLTSEVPPAQESEAPPPGSGAPTDGGGGEVQQGEGETAAPFFGCQLCGGARDPYNLIEVRMHKWHWADILASVERAAKGGT